jgi:hypothetical protein
MSDVQDDDNREDVMTGEPEPGSNAADAADNKKRNITHTSADKDVHGEPENPSGG